MLLHIKSNQFMDGKHTMRKIISIFIFILLIVPTKCYSNTIEGSIINSLIAPFTSNTDLMYGVFFPKKQLEIEKAKLLYNPDLKLLIQETTHYKYLAKKIKFPKYTYVRNNNVVSVCYEYCYKEHCGCLTRVNYDLHIDLDNTANNKLVTKNVEYGDLLELDLSQVREFK